jgi:hypothetical protein
MRWTKSGGRQSAPPLRTGSFQAKGLGTVCTVRDFSAKGALLNGKAAETPQHLTLVIVSEKLVRKCRVIWRDGIKWVLRSSDTATEFIVGTRPNGPPERERVQYLI